jgi:hypothetical protein
MTTTALLLAAVLSLCADAGETRKNATSRASGAQHHAENDDEAYTHALITSAVREALADDVELVRIDDVQLPDRCRLDHVSANERIRRSRHITMQAKGTSATGKPCRGTLGTLVVVQTRAAPGDPATQSARAARSSSTAAVDSAWGHEIVVVLHAGRLAIETRGARVRCGASDDTNATCARLASGRVVQGVIENAALHVRREAVERAEEP